MQEQLNNLLSRLVWVPGDLVNSNLIGVFIDKSFTAGFHTGLFYIFCKKGLGIQKKMDSTETACGKSI
jgi:hypothetical protein